MNEWPWEESRTDTGPGMAELVLGVVLAAILVGAAFLLLAPWIVGQV